MNIDNKLKIAIIGCGGIALQKHLPALVKLTDKTELVGFCDVIKERAEQALKEYGSSEAKAYTDYKNMLEEIDIDVVHVCTPNISHAEITIYSLEAGKHVMCEKPMAINSKEAEQMLETARRTGKKLTIGYQNRFRQDSIMLHEACKNDELGDIYLTKAHAVRRRGVPTWGVP